MFEKFLCLRVSYCPFFVLNLYDPNFSSDDCNHPKVINHKTHPSTFTDGDSSSGDEEETNMIYQVLKIALPVLSGLFIIGLVIFYGYHYRTNYSQDCCTFIFYEYQWGFQRVKWDASFRWLCRPNSTWGSKGTTTIEKTHLTLGSLRYLKTGIRICRSNLTRM